MPVVDATDAALDGYGRLVDDPSACSIEIVRWPSTGAREVDADTGDQAGTTEGVFVAQWEGDILYGRNEAVGGHYVLAYAAEPADADTTHRRDPAHMMLWHANYHPDGGQLFFPLDRAPFMVPLARPGRRRDARGLRVLSLRRHARALHPSRTSGTKACSPLRGTQRFFDKQGAVHARVSVDFAREFGCLIDAAIA